MSFYQREVNYCIQKLEVQDKDQKKEKTYNMDKSERLFGYKSQYISIWGI